MGSPHSGHTAMIFVSGEEIIGPSAWTLAVPLAAIATPQVGDAHVENSAGQYTWSGSITAWDQADKRVLMDAALAGVALPLIIYPVRATLGNSYSGDAIFSATAGGSTTAGVSMSATFTGKAALLPTGWPAA